MWDSFTNADPKIALAQFPNVSTIKRFQQLRSAKIQLLLFFDYHLIVFLCFQPELSLPRGQSMSATDILKQTYKEQQSEDNVG